MLNNGGVIGKASLESGLRFRRLADSNILDVGASKDNVFVDFISRGDRPVSGSIFSSVGSDFRQCNGRIFGVNGVQDSLVPNF